MMDPEFHAFLAKAKAELESKQGELDSIYRISKMKRWWFEQDGAKLQFFDDNDRLALEAEVTAIGSFSPKSNTWMWAWGNTSLLPELREKSLPLKELEDFTGLDLFGNSGAFPFPCEAMAWELVAMAVHHLKAMGYYRAPASSDGPHTYLAIIELRSLTRLH